MNYRMVFSMIGRLLMLEAGLLLLPAICSAVYGESSVWALLITAGIALLVGGGMVVVTLPKGGTVAITLKNGKKITDSFSCATTAVYDETTGDRIG